MTTNHAALKHAAEEACAVVPANNAPDAAIDVVDIDTRFGTIRFDRNRDITMPRGMAGFPSNKAFGIANLPDPRFSQFLVLQSLEDTSLSFLLLPEPHLGPIIASKHREAAAQDLGIATADMVMAFVVAIRRKAELAEISVNIRAPVLVDARRRLGWQYILPYGDYPVRHVLNRPEEEETAAAR